MIDLSFFRIMEVLPPDTTEAMSGDAREIESRQALAAGASSLSVDEQYILRRMALALSPRPDAVCSFAGILVSIPLSEFALHAGLTPKVAYRRLDVALHAIFDRSVTLKTDEGDTTRFRWITGMRIGHNSMDLTFTGDFINFLYSLLYGGAGTHLRLDDPADVVMAQASVCLEVERLFAFPIEINSKRHIRRARPKWMPFLRLRTRVLKPLKSALSKEQLLDIQDALSIDSPWRDRSNPRYFKYNHRDLPKLRAWVVAFMREQGFLE
jgi:hypothetical protein